MKDKKDRHTVWMEPAVWDMVEKHYHEDNCSTGPSKLKQRQRHF